MQRFSWYHQTVWKAKSVINNKSNAAAKIIIDRYEKIALNQIEKNNKHLIGWRFLRLRKETEVPGMFQRGRNHLPYIEWWTKSKAIPNFRRKILYKTVKKLSALNDYKGWWLLPFLWTWRKTGTKQTTYLSKAGKQQRRFCTEFSLNCKL